MDKTLKYLIEELIAFKSSHEQVSISRKEKRMIKDCYRRLKLLEDDSLMGVHCNEKSVKIRIVSKKLIICHEVPALLNLINISDMCYIDRCKHGFIIDLEFNLWKWKAKETPPAP